MSRTQHGTQLSGACRKPGLLWITAHLLVQDMGAAKEVDVAHFAALVHACADSLRSATEGGAQGLLSSSGEPRAPAERGRRAAAGASSALSTLEGDRPGY
jgi:hypothetical protein